MLSDMAWVWVNQPLGDTVMPQLNTSEAVRQRINQLITRLVEFTNDQLEGCDHLLDKIRARWIEQNSPSPKLVIETEIRFLAELVFQQQGGKTKDYIKQDLHTLEKFLGILEDNRTRTQGSSTWHFTLRLWHTSVDKNLEKLNDMWHRHKQRNVSAGTLGPSPLAVYPLPPPMIPSVETPLAEHSESQSTRQPYHNLPAKDYGQLMGRDLELNHLWHQLASEHFPARIGIKGVGGVGKTSLVLEIAHQFLRQDATFQTQPQGWSFEAIIVVSAQQHRLSSHGLLERHRYEPTLLDIFRAIAQTFGRPEVLLGDADTQLVHIRALLNQQPTLLIVDNLEAIAPDAQKAILSFLYDLPLTVKVLVTSRDHVSLDTLVVLEPLSRDASRQLIDHHAQLKAVKLSPAEVKRLLDHTGGIPAAMVYAIGQIAGGYPLASVLPKLTLPTGDYCRYYLATSVIPLRGHPAHQLLMALAMFPQPALREAISYVALDQAARDRGDEVEGFALLHQRSLVTVEQDYYSLLPPTREYAFAELRAHPDFEQAARNRWVEWALEVARPLAMSHWREWSNNTFPRQTWGNLQTVIEWCVEHNNYDDFSQLWPLVKGYTHIHGYWNERLTWLTWWVEAAQARQDQTVIFQALRDKGWTLMLMGHWSSLTEAEACFEQVWSESDRTDSLLQLELIIEYVTVLLNQDQLKRARGLLTEAKALLADSSGYISEALALPLDLITVSKQALRIDYYTAEVDYRQGHYDRAKALYQKVVAQARATQWVQVEVYALNWLADIALHQHQLDEAEALLEQSLPLALQYSDKRSQAFHHKTKTRLRQLRGNLSQFREQGNVAIAAFEDLGMQTEVETIQAWLANSTDSLSHQDSL